MRRARIALLVALCAAAALPGAAHAAGTTSVDFENLAEGTQVNDQYAPQGVHFGGPSDFGLGVGTECGDPVIASPAITNRSANISCTKREFGGLYIAGAFDFDSERRAVSFKLKAVGLDQTVTVSVHAIGGTTLESRSVSLPAGAVVPVSFTRPTPDMVTVRITGGRNETGFDDHVYLDDISAPIEDPGAIQPKFSVTLLQPRADLVEGSAVGVPVRVNRYNGSVGPVQLSIDSLPSGIVGTQFTPNPVTGRDVTTLRVSASSPLAGDRQLTIVASKPPSAPASVGIPVGASGVQTVHAIPALAFTDRAAGEFVFTPGCSTLPTESVTVRGGYRGRVALRSEVVAGAVQPQQTSEIVAGADGALDFSYPMPFAGPGSGVVRITLFPAGATPVTRDIPVRVAPPITSVAPTAVKTPQAGQPGTLVTLRGEGLCASGNARVRFGNKYADAPIESRNPQGTSVTARVPRLATTGHVQIVPDASKPGTVLDGPQVTVDSYRNTVGFSFHNFTPHLTVDQMSDTFGRAATHVVVDGCGVFSLGLLSCRIITPIPDPWAMVVLGIANMTMGGGSGGACFGFSRTSQQIRLGRRPLTGLGNDMAANAFQLPAPGGPGGSINEAINSNQLAQLSGEYAGFYLAHAVGNQVTQDANDVRDDVRSRLRRNDHPLLSLREGGKVDKLHVVVAYDVEDDPNEIGAYYIDVYDSNAPFAVPGYVEKGTPATTFEDSNADTHKTNAESSRIHVHGNGHWELPSSGMSASSIGNIVIGGIDDPPARPTLITAKGALKSGVVALFGSTVGALISQADPTAKPPLPPSTTTQISSGGRHLFSEPGVLERDQGKALAATPWVPATGGESSVEGFLLGAGGNASYTVDLEGGRAGSQTRTVLGDGIVSQVTAPARKGVSDELTVAPGSALVGFKSGRGTVPLTLQTMARRDDGTTRGAELAVTGGAGAGDSVAFDAARNVVRITHHGGAATAQLTLTSFGRELPQSVRVKLRVSGTGVTTVRPRSWTRLRDGSATVRAGGKARTITLRGRSARGATVSALKIVRRGGRVAQVKVKVPSTVLAGTANVTFAVVRGKKLVASKSLPAGAAGTRTLSWKLPAKVRRGDRLTAVATTVVQRGTLFDSAVSRRTAKVRR
ncbi:MAG TPA: IPT/TIG domain-containing protein [Baekduia sp.]|nr:IPT/TIG domain-containing protein [Baekduia sp.]